jgi:DNA-binding transcriptional LysR family regulator
MRRSLPCVVAILTRAAADSAHWLVWPPHAEEYPKIRAFRQWAKREAKRASVADSSPAEATRNR